MSILITSLTVCLGVVLAIASVPVLLFSVELLSAAWVRPKSNVQMDVADALTLAVLIPAHNEAACIAETLQSIRPQLRPQDQLLVVADNCTDETANLARQQGATVLERHHDRDRGKGFALDFGLQHLAASPPAVVVLIDADCDVKPGCIAALTHQAHQSQRPVQATYLMAAQENETLKDAISRFAVKVKNFVRPLGLRVWGQPCLLNGTGMAFPWEAIRCVDLATASIVEDMKMGLDLAIAGYPPQLCPEAVVTSVLPTNDAVSTQQRTRWEHGHLQIISTYVLPLLGLGLRQGRLALIALGLEVAILPLTLLVALYSVLVAILLGVGMVTQVWGLFAIAFSLELLLVLAILTAWARYGRDELSAQQLFQLPVYMLWKIPILLKFVTKRESGWVKTER